MSDAWAWPIGLGLLGLVFGSFAATVAVRWPQGRSALTGRSQCDGCRRALSALDLIPLASWAVLRGRCRRCGAAIDLTHPTIEVLGLAIGVVAGTVAPGWDGAAGAVFGWLLLALGAVDRASYRLPIGLNAALALTGLATGLTGIAPPLVDRLIGGVAGFAALFLVAWGYRRIRGRTGLGGGDVKMFAGIGLWLGWRALAPTLLVAAGLGLAVVALWMLHGKQVAATDRLPLGTLLAVAAFLLWAAARF